MQSPKPTNVYSKSIEPKRRNITYQQPRNSNYTDIFVDEEGGIQDINPYDENYISSDDSDVEIVCNFISHHTVFQYVMSQSSYTACSN
jgi:hypothetical protein